jgi:hypothetical protein
LLELVGDEGRPGLVTRLGEVKGGRASGEGVESNIREDRPVVFLADCTPDMNRDRGTLKRQLEDRGFCVVPMRTFYHAPPNFAEEVRQLLAQSKLFIQIVGPFRYELTAAFPKGYEVWQLQQAHEVLGRRGRGH